MAKKKDKSNVELQKEKGVLMISNTGDVKGFPIDLAQKVYDKSLKKGLWKLHPEEDRYVVKDHKIVEKKNSNPSD